MRKFPEQINTIANILYSLQARFTWLNTLLCCCHGQQLSYNIQMSFSISCKLVLKDSSASSANEALFKSISVMPLKADTTIIFCQKPHYSLQCLMTLRDAICISNRATSKF